MVSGLFTDSKYSIRINTRSEVLPYLDNEISYEKLSFSEMRAPCCLALLV